MNVRKPTDYSAMFVALNELVAADLPHATLAVWSAAGRKKVRLWQLRSICIAHTLIPLGSLPGTCGG